MTEFYDLKIRAKVRAILCFGPIHAGPFYENVVDPNMVSPKGDYIRFGLYTGDQINGWQKVSDMTVCEVLAETEAAPVVTEGYVVSPDAVVTLRAVK